ncbi:MAG: glycosyltransferase [bacterium]|nr:glycosyltransferase [bacterium]
MSSEKKICVIVPAKGESKNIIDCVTSLLNLECDDLEIVLVNDGLQESGLSALDKFKGKIKILDSKSKGPSFARNLAAKNTTADYLAFTDSDCIVARDWLKQLLAGFERHRGIVACGGDQRLPSSASGFAAQVFLFMKRAGFITDYIKSVKNHRIVEVNHNPSCNVMYRREIFLEEGGFLEGLWPGEDVELDYRLRKKDYKLAFNPDAIVYHYPPSNLRSFFKMMYRYGKAQGILVKKYGFFRRVHFLPVFSFLFFFLLVFSVFNNIFPVVFLLGMLSLFVYFHFCVYSFLLCVSGVIFWNSGFFKGLVVD